MCVQYLYSIGCYPNQDQWFKVIRVFNCTYIFNCKAEIEKFRIIIGYCRYLKFAMLINYCKSINAKISEKLVEALRRSSKSRALKLTKHFYSFRFHIS